MSYRILAIDGGGVRGVIPARIMQRVEQLRPNTVGSANLLAGTSSGSITALALASAMTPAALVDYFVVQSPKIFSTNFVSQLSDGAGLLADRYKTADLQDSLVQALGTTKLIDFRQKVLVPAFELNFLDPQGAQSERSWKAKFFHNFPGPNNSSLELAADVAVRSSSAPAYFPIYQGFVDGGVVANNLSMCALAQALNPDFGNQILSDIRLISFGTGIKREYVNSQNGDWGLLQWGFTILHMILNGAVALVDYQCNQILNDNYFRVDLDLAESIDLDAADKIPQLLALADACPDSQLLPAFGSD